MATPMSEVPPRMSTDLDPECPRSVLVIDQLQPLVVPQLGQA